MLNERYSSEGDLKTVILSELDPALLVLRVNETLPKCTWLTSGCLVIASVDLLQSDALKSKQFLKVVDGNYVEFLGVPWGLLGAEGRK